MDQLMDYKASIRTIMEAYARLYRLSPDAEVDEVFITDNEQGVYVLQALGWSGAKRIKHTHLYVRLRNGKIWIEEDWTERGIANDLVQAGVPREDLVLGFQPPEKRALTEFAVA
jgi:hypothetical protein